MSEAAGHPIDPNPVLPAVPPGQLPYSGQPPYYGGPVPPSYLGYSPFPGYPAYPPVPGHPGPARPGNALAACVLGYIVTGLLVVAGALLLIVVWVAHDVSRSGQLDPGQLDPGPTGTLVFAAVVDLAAAAMLLGGAVTTMFRRAVGRLLYTAGAGLCLLAGVGWLATTREASILPIWLLLVTPATVGLGLIWTASVNRWMAASAG